VGKNKTIYRQPLYRRRPLRFNCTRCGACCTGNKDHHVYLGASEAEKIRVFLALGRSWFRRRYLARDGDSLILQSRDSGACILLGRDGQCRAYAVRPVQCSTYPFWPEVMKTATAWQREKQRCEGIDQGAIIPVARIEKALRQCREAAGEQ
jgi:Fe-S-cluster containining protein